MGGRIADSLLEKGYSVFVCDKDKKLVKHFAEKGAITCQSPKEITQYVDVVFEVTPNDTTAREVWLGKEGVLASATPEKTLITCATLSTELVDELIVKCHKAKVAFFDISLTVGQSGLNLLCGGSKEELEEIRPALQVFAEKILYFDSRGHGIRYKLILNFLQAVHIVALGQTLKIASDQHMDIQKVAEALVEKVGGNITKGTWLAYQNQNSDGKVTFPVELITKDLTYAKQLAKHVDVNLLDAVLATYEKAMAKGLAKKSWTAINTLE